MGTALLLANTLATGPADVQGFLVGQGAGAAVATLLFRWLMPPVTVAGEAIRQELPVTESLGAGE